MRQLNDPSYYQKLNENPTKRHEKIVTETVLDLIDQGEIDEDMAPLLIPANSRTSKFISFRKYIKKDALEGQWFHRLIARPKKSLHMWMK